MERSLKAMALMVAFLSTVVGAAIGCIKGNVLEGILIAVYFCLMFFFDPRIFPSLVGESGTLKEIVQGKSGRLRQVLFIVLIAVFWLIPVAGAIFNKDFWMIPFFLASVVYVVWLFAHGSKKKRALGPRV